MWEHRFIMFALMVLFAAGGLGIAQALSAEGVEWTQTFEMDKHPAVGGWFGKTTRTEVADGVLRVTDASSERGEGHCFTVEWEADPKTEAVVEARMKVVSAEGDAGVCLWISNGVNEEGVQFQKDGINLAFSKLTHSMDTAEDFHVYRLTIHGQDMRLYVDGKLSIDASSKFTHPAHRGRNVLSFGSASSAAKGESVWDYVRFKSPMRIQTVCKPPEMEHVTIFRENGTYAVFPGVRHDEQTGRLSVAFRTGGPRSHIDAKGARSVSMVSDDGGKRWREGPMLPGKPFRGPKGRLINVACKWWQEHPVSERGRLEKEGYLVRDVRKGVVAICAGTYQTWSDDGGKTWQRKDIPVPPMAFLASGMNRLQLEDGTILFPVYAGKKRDGPDSSWVLRSADYGQTWCLAPVGIHPDGKTHLNEPEIIALARGRLMIVMRTGVGSDHLWQAFSDDGGATWHSLRDTGIKGHPPDLLRLRDGRVLLSYGYRHPPFGVRAAVSADEGETWDLDQIWTLRDDGGGTDLGYPHSVQLKDGAVVTVYYFVEPGGMQYVACTRWRVP